MFSLDVWHLEIVTSRRAKHILGLRFKDSTSLKTKMYEQVSHARLNEILDKFKSEISREDLRHFYTRLGANFYAIHTLFAHLSELGVNIVHILPVLDCPEGASDGGYAVSDFRDIDPRVGTLD